MKMIQQIESRVVGCRSYTFGLFLCPECGREVAKIKRDGLRAGYCSRQCAAKHRRRRGPYRRKVINKKYVYLYRPDHPNAVGTKKLYVAEHRLVVEAVLGRHLTADEVVHHKNHNTMDNREDNLALFTISQHNQHHAKERRRKRNGQF